ncbi:MAG: MFS transporter [Thermomicrobiales bacterium]
MSAVASEAPASEATWRTFAIVAAAIIIGQGSLSLVSAALPLHLSGIGVPEARIGAEVGSANLVGLVCTLLVGPLINRAGPHRLLRAGMGCYLVAAIGLLLVHGEVLVVLCRALQGCGTALVMPSALTMAPRVVPLRPGAALGVIGSLNNVSLAIAPPLGLWLYDQGGGPRLFGPAVACAGGGLLAGLLLPALASTGQRARGFGFDRRWIPTLAANGLLLAYFGGLLGYLSLSLAHPGAPNAGLYFAADAFGVMILRTPSGALVDRYGARPAMAIGVVITLAGLGTLALTPSSATLIGGGIITGLGAGLFIAGVLVTLAKRSGDHNRGTAMAMSAASLNFGILAGSTISGPLYGAAGFGAVLLFGTVTTLATLPFIFGDRER